MLLVTIALPPTHTHTLNPLHQPICTFSNAVDSLGAHVPNPSTPHSSNLDWFCLLNLLLSYSLTILRPLFKASSILICHPHAPHPPFDVELWEMIYMSMGLWTMALSLRLALFLHPMFPLTCRWKVQRKKGSCSGLLPSAGWDCVLGRSVSHNWTAVQ